MHIDLVESFHLLPGIVVWCSQFKAICVVLIERCWIYTFNTLVFFSFLFFPLHMHISFVHCHSSLYVTGRVTIELNVDIPEDVILVEPLEEKSVWCQARGSAVEVSGAESRVVSSEKVSTIEGLWVHISTYCSLSFPEPLLLEFYFLAPILCERNSEKTIRSIYCSSLVRDFIPRLCAGWCCPTVVWWDWQPFIYNIRNRFKHGSTDKDFWL